VPWNPAIIYHLLKPRALFPRTALADETKCTGVCYKDHLFGKPPLANRCSAEWCKQGTWRSIVCRLHLFSHSTNTHSPQPSATPQRCYKVVTIAPRPDQSTKRIINEDCHIKRQNRKQQNCARERLANEITWRPEVAAAAAACLAFNYGDCGDANNKFSIYSYYIHI